MGRKFTDAQGVRWQWDADDARKVSVRGYGDWPELERAGFDVSRGEPHRGDHLALKRLEATTGRDVASGFGRDVRREVDIVAKREEARQVAIAELFCDATGERIFLPPGEEGQVAAYIRCDRTHLEEVLAESRKTRPVFRARRGQAEFLGDGKFLAVAPGWVIRATSNGGASG